MVKNYNELIYINHLELNQNFQIKEKIRKKN